VPLLRLIASLLVATLVLVPAGVMAQADVQSVVDAYEAARNRQDVEGILGYFADDAVITDRSGKSYIGKDQIRQFMLLRTSRFRATTFAMHQAANRVSWTERITTQISTFEFPVEAVVEGGKIRTLLYGDTLGTGRVDLPPEAGVRVPALLGMGLVAAVLTLVLLGVSLPAPRRIGPPGLQGHLVSGLQRWTEERRGSTGA